ncbi:hypothetical protein QQS21_000777 [Conoideocrella luteorostrata]|uniref:Uncharacterized protein n=1 Tax=Conoideocrella luteorostrata TaxID=1105319 RepID=A0AAJ0G3V1_9HYPO|nr:hypothetical protein QQS21_000777 [Conoideocrella luteorostrata]
MEWTRLSPQTRCLEAQVTDPAAIGPANGDEKANNSTIVIVQTNLDFIYAFEALQLGTAYEEMNVTSERVSDFISNSKKMQRHAASVCHSPAINRETAIRMDIDVVTSLWYHWLHDCDLKFPDRPMANVFPGRTWVIKAQNATEKTV